MSRILETALTVNSRRKGVAVAACLAVTALVSGCGGGDKVKAFQPTQIIAFGDEYSAFETESLSPAAEVTSIITMKGMRYTINLVDVTAKYCQIGSTSSLCTAPSPAVANGSVFSLTGSDTFSRILPLPNGVDERKVIEIQQGSAVVSPDAARDVDLQKSRYYFCTPGVSASAGIWVQTVASAFGSGLSFGGDQCSQDFGNAKSYAAWGAKVSDVATQVGGSIARGELRDGVLVTLLAGQNDIMAAYDEVMAQPQTLTELSALRRMRDKGAELGAVINNIIANTGGRVAYLTVPDMGRAPKVSTGRPAFATELTRAFNEGYENSGGLVLSVVTNGHRIVKVDAFNQINAITGVNVTSPACDSNAANVKMPHGQPVPTSTDANLQARILLLNCTSDALKVITAATSTTPEIRAVYSQYLWADNLHLGPVGHNSLASLAIARISAQL